MPSETRELVRRAREWAQGIRGLPYVADRARLLEQLADIAERAAHQERDADALSAVHRTLAFFRSVIQSGESWSETCQREYDMAMGVLDAAMAADTQAEGDDAE